MSKINNNRNSIDTGLPALQTELSVCYSGGIDKQVISRLLLKVENCLASYQCAGNSKNNVISIAVELLQNIYHHCPVNSDTGEDSPAFLFEKREDYYILTTTNLIEKSHVSLLRKKVTEWNTCTPEELNTRYRDVLYNGKLNSRSAGLGLIDILRKSGNPIVVTFSPKDNKYTLLTVIVSISLNR